MNLSNEQIISVLNGAIMFPIVNGIPLMASILVSFILFKEKMSKKQVLGLIIGIVAIVFLCV